MQLKSNINRKIRAFTLQETIVVLCITTLVVALSFAVLQLVQGQMFVIEKNLSRNTELNRLRQALWADFYLSDRIRLNLDAGGLHCENSIREVRYVFLPEAILRGQDTFRVRSYHVQGFFENQSPVDGLVDGLSLQFGEGPGSEQIFVFKPNTPEIHMNR